MIFIIFKEIKFWKVINNIHIIIHINTLENCK